jgi:capsular polysaccharide export protein
VISRATRVVTGADDELALIAAIAGVPLECVGEGAFKALAGTAVSGKVLQQVFGELFMRQCTYRDPFTGESIPLRRVIEISVFWKRLIHSNRDLRAAAGFAFWKQPTVAPLLWNGATEVPFDARREITRGESVAVWKSRVAPAVLANLTAKGANLVEVEDGFIRSAGLGADCVPPLSITIDRRGIYFDPSQPSDLENLLAKGHFSSDLVERAGGLREVIVTSGLSKYERGTARLERRGDRRHILVPGQVEDDRSVQCGGGAVKTNLELLRRARQEGPDAHIIYKPHPDVEAGHRVGAIAAEECFQFADEIVRDVPISSLIDMVDEVHVNTSLAGFEALLRGKSVTTHGVPFYAGWGLTRDLGPVPDRRGRPRTIDELVAAVLLLYPRYLDPETKLPCPPEILIQRLSKANSAPKRGLLVRLRKLQGRLRRGLIGAQAR